MRFPWGSFSSPCVCHCVFVYLDSFFVSFHHHPLPQTVLLVSDSRRRLLSRHPTPAYLVRTVGAVATSMPATRSFGDPFLARSGDWRCRTLRGKGTRKLSRERVRKNGPAFFTESSPKWSAFMYSRSALVSSHFAFAFAPFPLKEKGGVRRKVREVTAPAMNAAFGTLQKRFHRSVAAAVNMTK